MRTHLFGMLFLVLLAGFPRPASATGASGTFVVLSWTAPGDDGSDGRASEYDLRYAPIPITAQNFGNATPVIPSAPMPLPAGTRQSAIIGSLAPNQAYYFAIRTRDERGNWSPISNVVQRGAAPAVQADEPSLVLALSSPWPNPARRTARMALSLPRPTDVHIAAYDVSGRLIRTLVARTEEAGVQDVVWDLQDATGRPVAAGVYLVRARLGTQTFTRRLAVTP